MRRLSDELYERHRVERNRRTRASARRALRSVGGATTRLGRDLRPVAWPMSVAAFCGTAPVIYFDHPSARDALVAFTASLWIYRHPIPRARRWWNGRRERWKFAWCDDLFDRCNFDPPPEIALDGRGRPQFWDHPRSRTIELICPTEKGAVTASALANAGSLIKSRIGGNCAHVKLTEGVGSNVTMIVTWDVPDEPEPIDEPARIPVALPEPLYVETPDGGAWRCETDVDLEAARAERRRLVGIDEWYPLLTEQEWHELSASRNERHFQALADGIEAAKLRSPEPAENRSPEPLSRRLGERSPKLIRPARGASIVAAGEGSASTPPPGVENAADTPPVRRARPDDATPGTATLRAWQLLCSGGTWNRQHLAIRSNLAASTTSTKLTAWKAQGLVEQTPDGWRALVADDDSQVAAP